MTTPTDPALASRHTPAPGRISRLASRIVAARRQAAVVTSVALLAAGGTVLTVSAPRVLDAPEVAVAEVIPEPPLPARATLLPPVAPVSDVGAPSDADDAAAETAEAGTDLPGGRASYYGRELAGNPTASGEPFDPTDLTAAHRTLPLGTRVRVTHARTGESVVVRINDRGPFHSNRVIDLSRAAADEIGLTRAGTAVVDLEKLPKAGARG